MFVEIKFAIWGPYWHNYFYTRNVYIFWNVARRDEGWFSQGYGAIVNQCWKKGGLCHLMSTAFHSIANALSVVDKKIETQKASILRVVQQHVVVARWTYDQGCATMRIFDSPFQAVASTSKVWGIVTCVQAYTQRTGWTIVGLSHGESMKIRISRVWGPSAFPWTMDVTGSWYDCEFQPVARLVIQGAKQNFLFYLETPFFLEYGKH